MTLKRTFDGMSGSRFVIQKRLFRTYLKRRRENLGTLAVSEKGRIGKPFCSFISLTYSSDIDNPSSVKEN